MAAAQKGFSMLISQKSYFENLLKIFKEDSAEAETIKKIVEESLVLIESFSNACRLTADGDIQHDSSMIRRNLIIGNLKDVSDSVKDAYRNAEIDKNLFGENFMEKLKSARANEVWLKSKQNESAKSNKQQQQSKNLKGPLRAGKDHRLTQNGQEQLRAPGAKRHQRQGYNNNNNSNNNYNNKQAASSPTTTEALQEPGWIQEPLRISLISYRIEDIAEDTAEDL